MRKLSLWLLVFMAFAVAVGGAPAWAVDDEELAPELLVEKAVDLAEAGPTDVLTYTISVVNIGDGDADNVIITDFVPAHTTYVPNSTTVNGEQVEDLPGGVSPLSGGINIGSLARFPQVGRDAVVTFQVTVDLVAPGTVIVNAASVVSDEVGPIVSNEVETIVIARVILVVVKSADPSSAAPTDIVTYTIFVFNSGNATGTNVIVQDALPASDLVDYIAGSTTVNGSPVADVDGTSPLVGGLNVGSIDASSATTVRFQVAIAGCPEPGTEIVNTATAVSDQTFPVESDPVVVTTLPDRIPPVITIESPFEGQVFTRCDSVTIRFNVTDECPGVDPASILAVIDGSVVVTDGQVLDLLPFTLGEHTLVVTARDLAGNEASAEVTFIIDCSFDCAIELVRRASDADAFACARVDSTVIRFLFRAKEEAAKGDSAMCRRFLQAALDCVTRSSRGVGFFMPGMTIEGRKRANFRGDAESEAWAQRIEDEIRCLLDKC